MSVKAGRRQLKAETENWERIAGVRGRRLERPRRHSRRGGVQLAAAGPAWRGLRMDPIEELREG